MNSKNTSILIWALAFFNVTIHLCFYNTLGFHRDELLYFSLGQHLAAGYASVPPFTGFIAWIIIHIFGYGLFGVRLLPALLGGIYIVLAASITRELKGGSCAQLLTAAGIIVCPFNLRVFYMFQPVCWDIFFWSCIFYLILRWINTRKDTYIILTGLTAGIGMMNKYLVALQLFSIVLVFCFTAYKVIFTRKVLYYAILLFLLVFLPNLMWQIGNDYPFITHMHALHDSQLVHVNRISFLTDQLFIGSLGMVLVIPGLYYLFMKRDLFPYRPLIVSSFLVVILLFILKGKSYYTIGLFPLWIACGAVYWENRLKSLTSRYLIILILVIFTLPLLPMGIPVFRAERLAGYFAWTTKNLGLAMVTRWESGRYHALPQDYADMLGWDELAIKTASCYDTIKDKHAVMIYGENYGQAGAIMVIGKKYGLPEPTCFAESFYYWAPRKLDHEVNTLIYINDQLGDDVQHLFSDIHIAGRIEDPLAREYGTTIWVCRNPTSSFRLFWEKRVPQVKSPF